MRGIVEVFVSIKLPSVENIEKEKEGSKGAREWGF